MRVALAALALVIAGAGCAPGAGGAPPQAQRPAPSPSQRPAAAPSRTPSPEPRAPAYYIESLRAREPVAGRIEIGELMASGDGYTKHHVTWTSGGQPMTGTISLPTGAGPHPVVIVNHGHIPPERYWIGQDSGIFGDPMAAHGFITIAPNYVGYNGSGPGDAALPGEGRASPPAARGGRVRPASERPRPPGHAGAGPAGARRGGARRWGGCRARRPRPGEG